MPDVVQAPPDAAVEDVARNLNPRAFGLVVRRARDHVSEPGVGGVRVACDLHRLVREEVTHLDYANFRHPPRDALSKGANCVDSTTLSASMLIRAGFQCRLVVVSTQSRAHMYPEVYIEGCPDAIADDVGSYYENHGRRVRGAKRLAFDSAVGGTWVPTDAATTDWCGSVDGLVELGYFDWDNQTGARRTAETEYYELSYSRAEAHE